MAPGYDGQDRARFAALTQLAAQLRIPTLASALPLMHHGARRKLADVLCAIRHGVRIEQLGRRALPNAECRLRSDAEMRRLFAGHEGAVDRAGGLAESLTFSLDELRYEYPSELTNGETAPARLARLTEAGLNWRYPDGVPAKARNQVAHELKLINKMGYEPYFLTVHDIVAFARERGILCQGRGSAANSVVCYALGVTSVSPEIGTMVFERFISEARGEPLAGPLAVAQVIVNPTEDGRFPRSYCGVVRQKGQFSFMRGQEMPQIRDRSAAWERAVAIAQIAHHGLWESEAGEAVFFHAKYVRPGWSRTKTRLAQIDTHIFYR
jgi:hypothetical protein